MGERVPILLYKKPAVLTSRATIAHTLADGSKKTGVEKWGQRVLPWARGGPRR